MIRYYNGLGRGKWDAYLRNDVITVPMSTVSSGRESARIDVPASGEDEVARRIEHDKGILHVTHGDSSDGEVLFLTSVCNKILDVELRLRQMRYFPNGKRVVVDGGLLSKVGDAGFSRRFTPFPGNR